MICMLSVVDKTLNMGLVASMSTTFMWSRPEEGGMYLGGVGVGGERGRERG